MKIVDGKGEVTLQMENGELITINYDQVTNLIIENKELRRNQNFLKNQLAMLKESIDENQVPISKTELEKIMG